MLYQLTLKKSEDEAVGALRMLSQEDVSGIQHMAAYINHVIKNYHIGGAGAAANASLPSGALPALHACVRRACEGGGASGWAGRAPLPCAKEGGRRKGKGSGREKSGGDLRLLP